jgi:hypothetical protein
MNSRVVPVAYAFANERDRARVNGSGCSSSLFTERNLTMKIFDVGDLRKAATLAVAARRRRGLVTSNAALAVLA